MARFDESEGTVISNPLDSSIPTYKQLKFLMDDKVPNISVAADEDAVAYLTDTLKEFSVTNNLKNIDSSWPEPTQKCTIDSTGLVTIEFSAGSSRSNYHLGGSSSDLVFTIPEPYRPTQAFTASYQMEATAGNEVDDVQVKVNTNGQVKTVPDNHAGYSVAKISINLSYTIPITNPISGNELVTLDQVKAVIGGGSSKILWDGTSVMQGNTISVENALEYKVIVLFYEDDDGYHGLILYPVSGASTVISSGSSWSATVYKFNVTSTGIQLPRNTGWTARRIVGIK